MINVTGKYSIVDTAETLELALAQCRGCYQRNIVMGTEAISGGTLRGRAKKWGSKYRHSAHTVLRRIRSVGIAVSEQRGCHGRRIIVLTKTI